MKKKLIPGFLLAFILVFSMAVFAACSGGYSGLHIDAPERVEADLGIYYIPTYHVVDESGAVYSGSANEDLKVKVKSIKDRNNNKVELTGNTITVREAGDYKFVYGVDGRGIEDVAVTVAFADRTAPTITLDEDLPAMYIVGNSYSMPFYSLAGDYVLDRCYAELYLSDDEEGTNLTKVQLDGNVFEVTKEQMGKYYLLRFHAEDAAGNYNEYNYYRPVDGPGEVIENTVVYFNDAFGARQAEPQESYYQGEAVSAAEAALPENEEMPGETGYYKLSFSGDKATSNHEGYLCVESPAITDIRSYTKLEFWVYFDPGDTSSLPEIDGVDYEKKAIIVGMPWWGDTNVQPKTWTKVSFNVQNWGGGNGNPTDRFGDAVLRSDISGMRLRFLWDYAAEEKGILPYGTIYLSRVTAVPGVATTIRCEDNRVWTNESTYYIGQTVTLSAEDAGPGETFDCFIVDGVPIAGNTFIATKATHTVTVEYVNGALTADNMKWSESFTDVAPLLVSVEKEWLVDENFITAYTAGSDNYWALSFDVAGGFDASATTNQKFGVSIYFGNTRTFEFQINGTAGNYTGNFKHYGSGNFDQLGTLSEDLVQAFIDASEEHPVHIDAVRLGDYLHVYVNGNYFYRVTIPGLTMYGNYFGYAWRVEDKSVTNKLDIRNAKAVTGETKATLAFESFSKPVTLDLKNGVTAEEASYLTGESVKLIAPAAPAGQSFLYFTVDGAKIAGDTFVATNSKYTVDVVYGKLVDVKFEDGAAYEGSLVVGATITLKHEDKAGKIFDYYLVDGTEKVFEDRYTLKGDTKSIKAVYADSVEDMTWLDGSQGKTPTMWGLPQGEISSHTTNGQTLYILGAADRWAIRETVYGGKTDGSGTQYYFSFMVSSCVQVEFQILSNGNVTIGMAGAGEWTKHVTESVDARAIYSTIANATQEAPVTFLCIRDGNDLYFFANGELLLKARPKFNYSNPFGYGTRKVTTTFPTTVSREFITDPDKIDALLAAQTSTIKADANVVLEKTEYRMGDTVTLTAAAAPDGKIFSHFTVDGVKLEGSTFVATKSEHTVKAVYADPEDFYQFERGEHSGFVTVNGDTLTLPSAQIIDKDGAPVSGYTIQTSVSDAVGNSYPVSNGQITLTEYAGSVTLTITYSVDGIERLTEEIEVVVQKADGTMFVPTSESYKLIDGNGNTVSYDDVQHYGEEAGSLKVVVGNSSNDTAIKLPKFDMSEYRYIELYAYTTASGVKLGGWWCMDQTLTPNAWTRILLDTEAVGWTNGGSKDVIALRIFGSCNNQTIYLSSVRAFDREQEGTRLTDISYYKPVSSITSAEYVTEKKYDGDDPAITEEGSLKVTIGGTDSGIASIFNYVTDLSAYSSVYFYVYTEVTGAKSGAYWCGDTDLPANTWTKVELNAAMASGGPWNADNSKIFEVGLKDMVVRFMGAANDVFYVTSLYGVPKA